MNAQSPDARMLLAMQAVLVGVVVSLYLVLGGSPDAHAALFGGACALVNAWLLGRRMRLAASIAKVSPGQEVTVIYVGALQRFALLLGLFIVGMGWLQLNPVPLLVAFGVAQVAFFLIKSWPQRAVS